MTKYKRDDIEVPRQDERDLRRALEAAKDVSFLVLALCLSLHQDKDLDVLMNVKSVCGTKKSEFLQDFKVFRRCTVSLIIIRVR